jgi:hypothetical protein
MRVLNSRRVLKSKLIMYLFYSLQGAVSDPIDAVCPMINPTRAPTLAPTLAPTSAPTLTPTSTPEQATIIEPTLAPTSSGQVPFISLLTLVSMAMAML